MMIRRLYCVALASSAIMCSARGEWVSLKNGASQPAAPAVTVLQDNGSSTILRIDLSGFEVTPFQTEGKSYQSIDLLTDAVTAQTGSPEVPYLAEMLAIPDRGGVTVEVVEMGETQRFPGYTLPPARPSWQEGAPEPGYVKNTAAYHSAAAYPESSVGVDQPAVFRDFRIARVVIYPVRYVPQTKEIQVVSSMTVRVTYGSGNESNPRMSAKRQIPHSFGAVYRSSLINYQSVLNREFGGLELGRDVLLCIVPDTFATAFKPYADWKNKTGTQVKVTKFSEIGANSTNPDIIKNYIASCYHTWQYPPTYVLLVGDYGQVPRKAADGQSFANEDYFVEIDGSDVFPEAYIGRFTQDVNSIFGLQTIINKVIKYERNPYRANQNWFKHSVVCANNSYPTQPDTKRWVSAIMRDSAGFTVDTLLNLYGGPCIHNVAEIKSAINNGRSFLNYRGEGAYDGWVYATCYPFNTNDVSTLNNGEMLTFVTSIGCGVAMFDVSGGNCFGEQWMELGTPTSARGACAFLGPTWGNTHTKYNNAIDKGLYVALFEEGVETPAPALLRGKIRMYNLYGGADPYVLWHFRAYTTLGDPSTHVWKDVPKKVDITYTSQISLGYDQVQVTVADSATHAPVNGAEICIAGDSIYVTGVTDETGIAVIPVSAPMIDTLTLLVRGVRVVPAEGTITVFSDQEHVTPLGDPTVSDLDGNHDGKINPNEHIQISYVLKNWGAQPSSNVQATLSATDTTYVSIVNPGPVSYGTLLPNGTGSPTGVPLQFYVKANAPVGSHVPLRLNVTSSSHAWNYVTLEGIVGCSLQYVATVVDDQGSPNSNGRLDPGETALVYLSITNDGQDAAPNVAGTLRCSDPHISILDSAGSFGTIAIGGNSINTLNYFIVSAADTCPIGSSPLFTVALSTQGGNYPYSVTREFPMTVGLPTGTDPSGPDSYGYYAYSNDDSLYEEAPRFAWVEIRGVGTRVPWASSGDFTVTAILPFTFKYYGVNNTSVRVSSDGWLAFGSGTQTSYTNYGLPHNDNVNNMVALFWDDLFEGSSNPTSKLLYYSDPANHRFIVEWDSVGHFSGTLRETFEAILLDPAYYPTPTGDGEVILQYRMVGEEGGCTIGIENNTQTIGLQYLFNSTYAQTATEIRDGSVIKFTTKTPSIGSTNMTVAVLITQGWNLVSNPVLRPDSINAVRRLYPHAQSDYAFRFDPVLGYVQSPVMSNGPGYWAKFPGGDLNSITGTRLMSDSIAVNAGWNIIGSISEYVDTATIWTIPSGLRTSNYFGYSGGYVPVTRLAPGQGYWVKSSSAGQFVLGSSPRLTMTGITASEGGGLGALSSLTIADSKGNLQTLYFGPDQGKTLSLPMFVMPPLPPVGAFDSRFESADGGTMVRTHPGETKDVVEFPISIQSSAYPLTVEWKIVGGGSYELIDPLGGQRVPARSLSGTGAFKVASSAVQKLVLRVLSSQEMPREFALSQNYPNPFNPSTLIRYALPVESRVSLRIYNVLGQEVGTLVNDVQGAGYRSISWDSRTAGGVQAASGVYFMRLRAEGANGAVFSDVRKMLLMK